MVGCCGQGQGMGAASRGAPGGQGGQGGQRCVSSSHNEEVCHGTGERRQDLLEQVKIFLDEFDDRPCQSTPRGQGSAVKPLGEYDEYRKRHCQSWTPAQPRPPLITSVQTHEVRATQDFERMRHQNTEYITYADGRVKPPPPTCDCAKRNGLQDQCPRPECTPPTPQCLATNPGPCCPPSMGLNRDEAAARPQRQNRAPGGGGAQYGQQVYGQGAPGGGGAHYGQSAQHGQQVYGQSAPGGSGAQYSQGVPMVCFCQESPSSMPKDKKYLCCPVPM